MIIVLSAYQHGNSDVQPNSTHQKVNKLDRTRPVGSAKAWSSAPSSPVHWIEATKHFISFSFSNIYDSSFHVSYTDEIL